MELDGILSLALGDSVRPQQGPKRLENGDSSTAVIVRTRRSQDGREEKVNAILVGAQHDGVVGLSRDPSNDTELAPGVGDFLHCCAVVAGAGLINHAGDLVIQPLGGLDAGLGLVVPGVEGCEVFQVGSHVVLGQVVCQGEDFLLVCHLLRVVDDALGMESAIGA